ncbi:hypothetical protein GCM10011496_07040 [Polaromonas eurypsychrophila]|uniref:Uncharacterized protein n=1 Tax=Polaromonas eurypsychrophila TaxID=1614635 RepID=A0A916S8H0_9BURK|nr:hypothetical protein GCM10011496_07040 [Polaromonas eurypsychrophila]
MSQLGGLSVTPRGNGSPQSAGMSVADLTVAIVDAAVQARHLQKRFTVAHQASNRSLAFNG